MDTNKFEVTSINYMQRLEIIIGSGVTSIDIYEPKNDSYKYILITRQQTIDLFKFLEKFFGAEKNGELR